eukprot:150640-Pelagomonas_calceolata.AAC.1
MAPNCVPKRTSEKCWQAGSTSLFLLQPAPVQDPVQRPMLHWQQQTTPTNDGRHIRRLIVRLNNQQMAWLKMTAIVMVESILAEDESMRQSRVT